MTTFDAQTEAEDRADCILGKAVHRAAHARLFELWPLAIVNVSHHTEHAIIRGARLDTPRSDERNHRQITVVRIENPDEGYVVYGMAECAPGDQWDRKKGIDLAFRRALDKVRTRVRYIEHQGRLRESATANA